MRYILILAFLFSSILLPAQKGYWYHVKTNAPSYGLILLSGSANGVSDVLKHKYSSSKFPQAGSTREYWDPADSWRRKYKDFPDDRRPAYPGSKTWLVWTTDGWHMSKMVQLQATKGAILLYQAPRNQPECSTKWWWKFADFAIYTVAFSAGWNISEHIFLKR